MRLIFFLSVILFVSCSSEKTPPGILPADKMEKVLWDLMAADELVAYQAAVDSLNKPGRNKQVYKSVLDLHKISEADFKKSFRYYEGHPRSMKVILDSLHNHKEGAGLPPRVN